MAHNHAVSDTDKRFIINPVTMAITNQSEKLTLVQGSHNSEIFTFEIPKEVEGHDMTLCNLVEIHYCNIKQDKSEKSEGVYKVKDLAVSSEDNTKVTFSWIVDGNATLYDGSLNFAIKFKCVDDNGVNTYKRNTPTFKAIGIGESYDSSEAIEKEYADILSEWEARLYALENEIVYDTLSDYKHSKGDDYIFTLLNDEKYRGKNLTAVILGYSCFYIVQVYCYSVDNIDADSEIQKITKIPIGLGTWNTTAVVQTWHRMQPPPKWGLDVREWVETTPATKEYIDNQLGDVDKALDNIIAIQNSYIGGAEE